MASTALGCGVTCIKYFIGLINLFLVVGGFCMVVFGIAWLVDARLLWLLHSIVAIHTFIHSAAIALIVVGLFIAMLGFLGCFGSFREHALVLGVYEFIVIVTIIIELGFGIVTIVYREQVRQSFDTSMIAVVEEKYGSPDLLVETESWDNIQTTLQCCGARDGSVDWTNTDWFKLYKDNDTFTRVVPDSCCFLNDATPRTPVDVLKCNEHVVNGTRSNSIYVHQEKCTNALWDWVRNYYVFLIATAFTLVTFEIVVAVCAGLLQMEVRNSGVYA